MEGEKLAESGAFHIKVEVTFIDSLTIKSVQKGLVCQNEIHWTRLYRNMADVSNVTANVKTSNHVSDI